MRPNGPLYFFYLSHQRNVSCQINLKSSSYFENNTFEYTINLKIHIAGQVAMTMGASSAD